MCCVSAPATLTTAWAPAPGLRPQRQRAGRCQNDQREQNVFLHGRLLRSLAYFFHYTIIRDRNSNNREKQTRNDSQRIQKIDAFIEQNKDALLRDLKTLVCIPSVQAHANPARLSAPTCAKRWTPPWTWPAVSGWRPTTAEGYMGYAQITGKSEKQIATIAHLDGSARGQRLGFKPL